MDVFSKSDPSKFMGIENSVGRNKTLNLDCGMHVNGANISASDYINSIVHVNIVLCFTFKLNELRPSFFFLTLSFVLVCFNVRTLLTT